MSAPFVTQLRARGDLLQLAPASAASITVRVEMPEVWDVVKATALPSTTITELKVAALAALDPHQAVGEYVMKLRGWEVLDENATIADVGARDGSIFLLTSRRRRPVR